MFEKGEDIVYGHNGICGGRRISHSLNLPGVHKGNSYYVLAPLNRERKPYALLLPCGQRKRWTRKAHDHQSRSRTVVK